MQFKWTDDLLVGVDRIDRQHKEIFARINNLFDAVWEGKGREETGGFFDFLSHYVVDHFRDEEAFMTERAYPNLPAHGNEHRAFVDRIVELRTSFEAGTLSSAAVMDGLAEACGWLRRHIHSLDREMAEHLRGANTSR